MATDPIPEEDPLLKDLGLPQQRRAGGPPVREEDVERYLTRRLGPEGEKEVGFNILTFRDWYEAFCRIGKELDQRRER